MSIEQDLRDLRDDFRMLRTRVQSHELVLSIILAHLLNVAKKAGVTIDMNEVIGQAISEVEGSATKIEKSDPMGAAGIRAIGADVLHLLKPAAASQGELVPANET